MEVVNKITAFVNDGLEYVNDNKLFSSILGLFLVLYAALAAPKLPKSVTTWFDNVWFKLGFMFLIAYMATKDPSVAIISAVALLVTLQTLSAQKTADAVVEAVQSKVRLMKEGFTNQIEQTNAAAQALVKVHEQYLNQDTTRSSYETEHFTQDDDENNQYYEEMNNQVYEGMDNEIYPPIDQGMEQEMYEGMNNESYPLMYEGMEQEMEQEMQPEINQLIPLKMQQEMVQGVPVVNDQISLKMQQEMVQGVPVMNREVNQQMLNENNVDQENNYTFQLTNNEAGVAFDESAQSYGDASQLRNNPNQTYKDTCSGSSAELLGGFDGSELAGATF